MFADENVFFLAHGLKADDNFNDIHNLDLTSAPIETLSVTSRPYKKL